MGNKLFDRTSVTHLPYVTQPKHWLMFDFNSHMFNIAYKSVNRFGNQCSSPILTPLAALFISPRSKCLHILLKWAEGSWPTQKHKPQAIEGLCISTTDLCEYDYKKIQHASRPLQRISPSARQNFCVCALTCVCCSDSVRVRFSVNENQLWRTSPAQLGWLGLQGSTTQWPKIRITVICELQASFTCWVCETLLLWFHWFLHSLLSWRVQTQL